MAWQVEIDADKCTGDEECVNVCPSGVLEMQGDKAVVANEDECLGCESCLEVCPSGAITLTETKIFAILSVKDADLASGGVFYMPEGNQKGGNH